MIELMLPPILLGICLALVSGPLGCFVVWRKMAYFGDTIAHAALLGIGLSAILEQHYILLTIASCLCVSGLLSIKTQLIGNDTSLGVIAHGSLALGLLSLGATDKGASITSILMGDILATSTQDILVAALLSTALLTLIYMQWKNLLLSSIDENLAKTEGKVPAFSKFILMISISLAVAFGIQLVGALLVSSLLIVPASAARFLSRSPEQMALTASLIGIASVITGISVSALFDLPSGPSIVVVALVFFLFSACYRK